MTPSDLSAKQRCPSASPIVAYLSTLFLAVVAIWLGPHLLPKSDHQLSRPTPFMARFANWDGEWYARIANDGYSYARGRHSSVAFFPLYPLLGAVAREITGVPTTIALLIVSHFCLFASLFVFVRYQRIVHPTNSAVIRNAALWSLAIFPPAFFLRMTYSESLYLLLAMSALLAMHTGKRPLVIAIIVGAATATRPTGIALIVPFALHLWQTERPRMSIAGIVFCIGLSAWGLLAYLAYLQLRFGDPLVFLWTQDEWWMRPRVSFGEQLIGALALEPIWSLYIPGSEGNWRHEGTVMLGAASLHFANPIWFAMIGITVFYGWIRGWVTHLELTYSVSLLAFSYFPKAFSMCMAGQARYAATVFPAYVVFGVLLSHAPAAARYVMLLMSAGVFMLYTAQFATWYMAI